MNRENAIQCLQVMKGAECIKALSAEFPEHYGVENTKALEMAITALESMPEYERLKERDRAKKPSSVDDNMGYFVCANCGGAIYYNEEKESHEFCLMCGQRIDWSEEEEHEN